MIKSVQWEMQMYTNEMIFVTGQAKPSKEDAINSVYQVFSLCVVIDRNSNIILKSDCTFTLDLTRKFFSSILDGKNIIEDYDHILGQIKSRFYALSQKTCIVAFKDVHNKYKMIQNKI